MENVTFKENALKYLFGNMNEIWMQKLIINSVFKVYYERKVGGTGI